MWSSVSRGCQSPLRGLGLQLELPQAGAPRVLVGRVPLCFTEKEHNEVRRGRPSVIKAVVEVSNLEPPAASPVQARFILTDGTNAVLSSLVPIRNISENSSRYALLYFQRLLCPLLIQPAVLIAKTVSYWEFPSLLFLAQIFCSTGSMRGTLPLTVLRVLASLACHGRPVPLLTIPTMSC